MGEVVRIIARTHTYARKHLCACGHIYNTQPCKHLSEVDSRVLLAQLRLTILLVSSEVTLPAKMCLQSQWDAVMIDEADHHSSSGVTTV